MSEGQWVVVTDDDWFVMQDQRAAVELARAFLAGGDRAQIAGPLWTPEPDHGPIEDTSGGEG